MAEIRNTRDLEVWLGGKPREWVASIAARAALRVFPISGLYLDRNDDLANWQSRIALPIFRLHIASVAAAKYPNAEVRAVAFNAAKAATHIPTPEHEANVDARAAAIDAAYAGHATARGTAYASAVDATDAAAKAADAIAGTAFWRAVQEDADWLERTRGSLWDRELWPENLPPGIVEAWEASKTGLLSETPYWKTLVQWYEDRLLGDLYAASVGRPPIDAIQLELANLPEEVWSDDEVANGTIAEIQMKYWQEEPLFEIPPQEPAALEPIWRQGRLVLPGGAASSSLPSDPLQAALAALKGDIEALVAEAREVNNIDQRLVRYLDILSSLVPSDAPDQVSLFRLGHAFEPIERSQAVVLEEWPDVLGFRYAGLVLAFDRTLKQFPEWKEFKRNAADVQISDAELEAAPAFVESVAEELRSPELAAIIDERIPEALQALLQVQVDPSYGGELGGVSKERATDALESTSNIVKRLMEPLLEGIREGIGEEGLRRRAGKSIGREMANAADNAGPAITKGLKKFAKALLYSSGIGAGAGVGWATFSQLEWLHQIAELLKQHL